MELENMNERYNELLNFFDQIEPKIKTNFDNLDDNLVDRYKDLSYKIDKMRNKHNFYIKNLRKIEELYKHENRFEKLNSDLEFFKNYSSILDTDIEKINNNIQNEKEIISKKHKLVIQYRKLVKSKIKKQLSYETTIEVIDKQREEREEREKEEEIMNEREEERFFITENKHIVKTKKIKKIIFDRNSNLQQSFNFFKECLNSYFKGYYNKTKASNQGNEFNMVVLDILEKIVKNNFSSKKNKSNDILDIIQSKLIIPVNNVIIDKGSKSYKLLFDLISQIDKGGFCFDDICEEKGVVMEKIPFWLFKDFNDEQIFLLVLHKIHLLNVTLVEWQQSISMNYKKIKKVLKNS